MKWLFYSLRDKLVELSEHATELIKPSWDLEKRHKTTHHLRLPHWR